MFILTYESYDCMEIVGCGTLEQCQNAIPIYVKTLNAKCGISTIDYSCFCIEEHTEGVFSDGDWAKPIVFKRIEKYSGRGEKYED